MAEAERFLLAGEAGLTGLGQIAAELLERSGFAARLERCLELELAVEMVLDDALVAAGNENEVLDTRFAGFVDGILDDRLVDDRQHLLGHGFGGGKKPCSKAGDRKDGCTDSLDHFILPCDCFDIN